MCSPCAFIRHLLQSFGSKIIRSPSRQRGFVDLEEPLFVCGYTYRHFSYLDPRMQYYLREFIPPEEDVHSFIRADMVMKSTSNQTFPGVFIFTRKRLYILKIIDKNVGHLWLDRYENISLENVKSMEAVLFNQGVSIECVDPDQQKPPGHNNFSYLLLLHDRRRTANFLIFMKNSEILPSNKINDVLLAEDRPSVSQLNENIEYFTISELIVIYKNNEQWKRFLLPGFAFTKSSMLILKAEEDSRSDSETKKREPFIIVELEMKLANLARAEDKKTLLLLQFVNEEDPTVYFSWYIRTGLGLNDDVIGQLNDLLPHSRRPKLPTILPVTQNVEEELPTPLPYTKNAEDLWLTALSETRMRKAKEELNEFNLI